MHTMHPILEDRLQPWLPAAAGNTGGSGGSGATGGALRVRSGRGKNAGRAGGFSLMEVLVALGIFAVGLVAVAAVFPTAISVQSETVRDLAGQRAVANARTTIQSLARSKESAPTNRFLTLTYKHDIVPTLREGTLVPFTENNPPATGRTGSPGGVQPMLDQPLPPIGAQLTLPAFAEMSASSPLNAAKSFHNLFSQDIRSYPQNVSQSDRRDYYWFPLIQARDLTASNPIWMTYIMVMQRRGTEAVPEVRAARINPGASGGSVIVLAQSGPIAGEIWDNDFDDDGLPDLIQPGDWVLDSRGTIHRVLLAERFQITVESAVPVSFRNGDLIYFAVAIEGGGNWQNPVIKRESRSPIVRIEQFEIVAENP